MTSQPVYIVMRHKEEGDNPVAAFTSKEAATYSVNRREQTRLVTYTVVEVDLFTQTGE